MAECTENQLREWRKFPAGKSIKLVEPATRLTLAIAGRTLFGLDLSAHSNVRSLARPSETGQGDSSTLPPMPVVCRVQKAGGALTDPMSSPRDPNPVRRLSTGKDRTS